MAGHPVDVGFMVFANLSEDIGEFRQTSFVLILLGISKWSRFSQHAVNECLVSTVLTPHNGDSGGLDSPCHAML